MSRAECSEISRELESWYGSSNGQYVLDCIHARLQPKLDTAFGYHIAQLGYTRSPNLISASLISHRLLISECQGQEVGLVSTAHALPLQSDSVDALVIHHALEFSEQPHQVLREAQRVLTPQGHLIILGFNPLSLLGLAARLRGLRSSGLWQHYRPLTEWRLTDWLNLVGCKLQSRECFYTLPPIGSPRLREALMRADNWCTAHTRGIGGMYLIHAMKQVHSGTLIVPRKTAKRHLIGLGVPEPAASTSPRQGAASNRQGDSAA